MADKGPTVRTLLDQLEVFVSLAGPDDWQSYTERLANPLVVVSSVLVGHRLKRKSWLYEQRNDLAQDLAFRVVRHLRSRRPSCPWNDVRHVQHSLNMICDGVICDAEKKLMQCKATDKICKRVLQQRYAEQALHGSAKQLDIALLLDEIFDYISTRCDTKAAAAFRFWIEEDCTQPEAAAKFGMSVPSFRRAIADIREAVVRRFSGVYNHV